MSSNSKEATISSDLNLKLRTRALEIELITKALNHTKGDRESAARLLGLSARSLLYKIKEYSIKGQTEFVIE